MTWRFWIKRTDLLNTHISKCRKSMHEKGVVRVETFYGSSKNVWRSSPFSYLSSDVVGWWWQNRESVITISGFLNTSKGQSPTWLLSPTWLGSEPNPSHIDSPIVANSCQITVCIINKSTEFWTVTFRLLGRLWLSVTLFLEHTLVSDS